MSSDLVVDFPDVVLPADQDVLVDELRSELGSLPRAAAHRQRSHVLLMNPAASLRSTKIRLHPAETDQTGSWLLKLCAGPGLCRFLRLPSVSGSGY